MGKSDSIAGLGSQADHVAPAPGADALRLGLSAEEATLFAHIGKVSLIGDVIRRSGLAEPAAIALLLSLRAKGAIVPARVSAPGPRGGVVLDAAMLEEVDLDPERKKEILERESGVETQTHYEVLELEPGAKPHAVKEAYYELSRRFHPDRFYNKNLGSFRSRVEKIFRRIREAHLVLSSDEKRAQYLAEHPELTRRAPPVPVEKVAHDEVREAERRARLSRHPYLKNALKANSLMHAGKAAMEAGRYAEAYSSLHEAKGIRPDTGEVPGLLEETRAKHEQSRAREELQAGNIARQEGKLDEALKHFRMAHSLDPNLSTAAWRAAELLLQKGDSLDEAFKLAEKAVKIEPRRADYHVTLGKVMAARDTKDSKKAAREHFEEALRLDPDHEEAKKGLKKTRWLF